MAHRYLKHIRKGNSMTKTLRVIFDGEVLRPTEPVDLQPNTWYVVTIEAEEEKKTKEEAYPLTQLLALATDMGVTDLSTRHSWYAHGRLEDDKHGT
jgi:Protein of unknown function DUF104